MKTRAVALASAVVALAVGLSVVIMSAVGWSSLTTASEPGDADVVVFARSSTGESCAPPAAWASGQEVPLKLNWPWPMLTDYSTCKYTGGCKDTLAECYKWGEGNIGGRPDQLEVGQHCIDFYFVGMRKVAYRVFDYPRITTGYTSHSSEDLDSVCYFTDNGPGDRDSVSYLACPDATDDELILTDDIFAAVSNFGLLPNSPAWNYKADYWADDVGSTSDIWVVVAKFGLDCDILWEYWE